MNASLRYFFIRAAGLAAAAGLATSAYANITLSTFISQSQLQTVYSNSSPIGITFAGDRFVGSGGYLVGSNELYQSNLTGTSVTPFGTLPAIGGEVVLSASPNGSAYGDENIFSGSGLNGDIYEFSHTGGSPTLFSTVGLGQVRGINFDTQGLYGDNLIVTTTGGGVWEVNSSGHASLLVDLGTDTEGIGFATQQFGTYAAGTMFTTSEGTDLVNAISPTGVVTPVFSIPEAESISFVPANIASETNPLEGFYGVDYPFDIQFAAASQFIPYAGDVIVTSEIPGSNPNIYAISLNSDDVATITGIGAMYQPEDSIFVTQSTLQQHGVPDCRQTAGLLAAALLALGGVAGRKRLLSLGA